MLIYLLPLLIACSCSPGSKYTSPPHYHFNNPEIIKLPEELNEISGLSYYAKDKSLFAESDEQGYIYKIPLDQPKRLKRWKVAERHDYEDIVLLDSTFYLLASNGNILTVRFAGRDSFATVKYKFPVMNNNEFESLYYEPQLRKLVMICKECDEETKSNNTVYSFDPLQHIFGKLYVMDGKKAVDASATGAAKFKPSAAAIHPITGQLFILSSVNKVIVVADRSWHIKEVYPLNSKHFYHPEGIAFDPSGGLYISNEAEEPDPATILYFEYDKETKK
jgi:uncharacterized protein YjiK